MLAGNRRTARSSESIASAYLPRAISAEIFKTRHRSFQPEAVDLLARRASCALVVLAGAEERLGLIQVRGARPASQAQQQGDDEPGSRGKPPRGSTASDQDTHQRDFRLFGRGVSTIRRRRFDYSRDRTAIAKTLS